MFEIPEYTTLARQMNESLTGKKVANGRLGNSPHKFVWYNLTHEEFTAKISGKTVGKAYSKGRWLFVPAGKDSVLVFGECGGKILLHESDALLPKKFHLALWFEDGSALSATTQMWGAMELYEKGKELERKYIKDMRTTPVEKEFTVGYLSNLMKIAIENGNKTVKAILTQEQLIPGLGNAIAQDILFNVRLHPKQPLEDLDKDRIAGLHKAIVNTLKEAIRLGGRNDEYDLYGKLGGYKRLMDSKSAGRPCPECGKRIEKIAYLGGACYFCPQCQSLS
jgi:formamidopyrimidine-DNA glycosylase